MIDLKKTKLELNLNLNKTTIALAILFFLNLIFSINAHRTFSSVKVFSVSVLKGKLYMYGFYPSLLTLALLLGLVLYFCFFQKAKRREKCPA